MATISVIVPVFNVEKYLIVCVDSILSQTFRDFELILVDDGSTDRSPTICDDYAKQDKRVFAMHKTNGGQGSARNMALDYIFQKSNSKYICFIDSDDYVSKDYLKSLYESISGYDLSMCSFIKVADDKILEKDFIKKDECLDEVAFWESSVNESTKIVPWNKLYKKELFSKIRYPEVRSCEDGFVIHHVIGNCKRIRIIPDNLYFYRVRESSTMKSLNVHSKDYFLLQIMSELDKIEYFYSKHNNNQLVKHFKRLVLRLFDLYLMYGIKDRNGFEIAKKYYKKVKHIQTSNETKIDKRDFMMLYFPRLFSILKNCFKKRN